MGNSRRTLLCNCWRTICTGKNGRCRSDCYARPAACCPCRSCAKSRISSSFGKTSRCWHQRLPDRIRPCPQISKACCCMSCASLYPFLQYYSKTNSGRSYWRGCHDSGNGTSRLLASCSQLCPRKLAAQRWVQSNDSRQMLPWYGYFNLADRKTCPLCQFLW